MNAKTFSSLLRTRTELFKKKRKKRSQPLPISHPNWCGCVEARSTRHPKVPPSVLSVFFQEKKKKGRHRRGAGSNHHCAGSWKATAKKRKAIGLDLSDTTRITSQLQIHFAPPPPQPRNVIKRGDRKSSTDKGRRGDANSQPESISIDWAPKEERDVTGRENIIHFLDATTPFLLSIHLCPVIKSRKKKEERKWPSLSLSFPLQPPTFT